jgi:hypothetical protein
LLTAEPITPTTDETMPDFGGLVPGGYIFTHMIFWTVVAMVAVGTNAVAIILSIGLGLLVVETATKPK